MNIDSIFSNLLHDPSIFFETHPVTFNKMGTKSSYPTFGLTSDELIVQQFSKNVIGGFLNLGDEEGWPEGHDNKLGAAFTRFILRKYYEDGKGHFGKYQPIFEKALEAFKETGSMVVSPLIKEVPDAHRPKTNRVAYDCAVTGWQRHAVCRMVGNIASDYGLSKPFFEVLVNSQRNSRDDPTCNPFYITIHNNEAVLDKRRQLLASVKQAPPILVHSMFYSDDLTKPEQFLERYNDKIGPNSKRILEGLVFLQNQTIQAQTVGNCWIKQPMRCLLVTLYMETLSAEKSLTPAEAWSLAKEFYLCIQRATAIPYIESLLENEEITDPMRESAVAALARRKTL